VGESERNPIETERGEESEDKRQGGAGRRGKWERIKGKEEGGRRGRRKKGGGGGYPGEGRGEGRESEGEA